MDLIGWTPENTAVFIAKQNGTDDQMIAKGATGLITARDWMESDTHNDYDAARSGVAERGFHVGGANAVTATGQPYGFEFSLFDPAVDGTDRHVQEACDFGDGQ